METTEQTTHSPMTDEEILAAIREGDLAAERARARRAAAQDRPASDEGARFRRFVNAGDGRR